MEEVALIGAGARVSCMASLMKQIVFAGLIGLTVFVAPLALAEQVPIERQYFTTYLDQPPNDVQLQVLPADARNVVIARVRMAGTASSLMPRHPWDGPPPRDRYAAPIEIVEVIRGDAKIGDRQLVFFGVVGGIRRYKYLRQAEYERYVVSYLSNDDRRRLVEFPITKEEFHHWWGP